MGRFHWKPDTYLELIRSEVPRYDELQEQAIAAIPFAPERVLELGMGTGETTRCLIEAYPEAWVIGLDSSADMVFRARENYDDVQLSRMEDPLPEGPWDLVIGVLSIHHLRSEQKQNLFRQVREDPLPEGPWDLVIGVLSIHHLRSEQKQNLFRQVREQARSFVIGDVVKADTQIAPIDEDYDFPEKASDLASWSSGEVTWEADDLAVIRAVY